jgi:hypothetical protein
MVNAPLIADAATLTARAILHALGYNLTESMFFFFLFLLLLVANDSSSDDTKADLAEIEEVMDCFVHNSSCSLVTERFRIDGKPLDDVFS